MNGGKDKKIAFEFRQVKWYENMNRNSYCNSKKVKN